MIDPAQPAFGPLFAAAAFLAGSIPFGLIIGRLFFGSDLRRTGSGNIGAANALRSLGAKGGAAVLALDALKGFVPTTLAVQTPSFGPPAVAVIAFAAIAGHCFSPWLGFRGGKGIATLLGAVFAIWWPAGVIFAVTWLAVWRAYGYASAASLVASACALGALYANSRTTAFAIFGAATLLLVLWKHRANIDRLRAGTESKLTFGGRPAGTPGNG
jgi:glycerol-3-phosphate acyltransferase PlsY